MALYQVGDLVQVKSSEWYEDVYKNSHATITSTYYNTYLRMFTEGMALFCGQPFIVRLVRNVEGKEEDVEYFLVGNDYVWKSWMFDHKVGFEYDLRMKCQAGQIFPYCLASSTSFYLPPGFEAKGRTIRKIRPRKKRIFDVIKNLKGD